MEIVSQFRLQPNWHFHPTRFQIRAGLYVLPGMPQTINTWNFKSVDLYRLVFSCDVVYFCSIFYKPVHLNQMSLTLIFLISYYRKKLHFIWNFLFSVVSHTYQVNYPGKQGLIVACFHALSNVHVSC